MKNTPFFSHRYKSHSKYNKIQETFFIKIYLGVFMCAIHSIKYGNVL